MKRSAIPAVVVALVTLSLPACHSHKEGAHHEHQKIVVTNPEMKDVTITQPYVCQIHARRNIEIRALQEGYLEAIGVQEGQTVEEGQVLFRVLPVLFKARLEAERAEAKYAEIELKNAKFLFEQKVRIVSNQEVALYEAKLAKAQARVQLAEAELNFTYVRAPFEGIIDRQYHQQGSLVKKEDLLTTLSDTSVMWVYFNVPEARYLEFKNRYKSSPAKPSTVSTNPGKEKNDTQLELSDSRIELVLADGSTFDQDPGQKVTVEGKFNNQTGNIAFRADFPNPERLLRHGQTGTIKIHRAVPNALVIPQRATFERLDKRYVWVIGDDHVAHQRLITVQNELEDTFVIKDGLDVKDKIVLEGVREIHEGDHVKYELMDRKKAAENQKHHAE